MVYGYDPSLPDDLAPNGGVYVELSAAKIAGVERIDTYTLNMHAADREDALARVRQELPADATVAWDLKLGQCYQVAFISATLEAAAHRMAKVQLQERQGATLAPSPHRFNQVVVDLDPVGTKPTPSIGC
jgi:hypothetical protein